MLRTLAAAAVLALVSCASNGRGGGPGSPVQLVAPAEVAWPAGGPFALSVEVRNASGSRLMMARPAPEALEVRVFREGDDGLVCATPRPSRRQLEASEGRGVPAAKGLALAVDLWPYCRALAPGEYRYEATYVANPVSVSGEITFTGSVSSPGGRIVLAAAEAPAPPAGSASPAPGAPPSAEAARACVDRELAARGLDRFGDPAGTEHPGAPPADEAGRILYVAGRNAEIRGACGIGGL